MANPEHAEFARRLHEKMRGEKLRVWFAPEDMQGGKKLIEQIDRAIQVNDRLLLVLSEHSMNSEWVKTEIRKARRTELREQRQKLFPIRLVSIDGIREWSCFDAGTGKDFSFCRTPRIPHPRLLKLEKPRRLRVRLR